MWQSKGSLCDRLGAYCRATWLLTLWQRKDKNLALTVWQALQPLCDNLKTDCATREVQTAEHTDFFWGGRYTNELGIRFLWRGRYTNELEDTRINWGSFFFEREDIRMNWHTYEMNWGSDFWRGKIYEWIGRHTNELGLQADWPAAAACHCVTMHDKLRAHCVTT